MKCDELKLFSYIEGISSDQEREEIEEHLKGCKNCQQKLEQLKFTVDTFTQFYSHQNTKSCPGGEELIFFKYGMMDKDHANEIRRHVDQCPDCQKELRLVHGFEKVEQRIWDRPVDAPPLSEEILVRIEQLKKDSARDRMEQVLRSLLARGKDAITADKIPELLDQYFANVPDTSPAYAIPSDATLSDTQLTLREFSPLTDITFDIGKYEISIKSSEDALTVNIHRGKKPVRNIEIRVETESFGELKGITDIDGICIIEGVPQGPCRLKIGIPRDK